MDGGQGLGGAYDDWQGREEQAEDAVTARDVARLAATIAPHHAGLAAADGADLPPLWHWLAFAPVVPPAELGLDGHPALGRFLPPIEGRRRMWAGGRLRFAGALKVGERLRRRSEITRIAEKAGATGSLVFVTVRHVTTGAGGGAVEEDQDIVYAALPDRFTPPPKQPAPEVADWRQPVAVDNVTLFRFSALTFNAHRIHFDLPYAVEVEKYPGLVVHGPLQAIWMMEAARARQGRSPAGFRFRGLHPLFPGDAPAVLGWTGAAPGTLALAVAAADGHLTMQGEAEFA
jgi:3-methylfumaryl-CoA hydratase